MPHVSLRRGDTPASLSSQGVKELRLRCGRQTRLRIALHLHTGVHRIAIRSTAPRLARWMDQGRHRDRELTAGRYDAVRSVTYEANGPLFTMDQVSTIFSERSARATD